MKVWKSRLATFLGLLLLSMGNKGFAAEEEMPDFPDLELLEFLGQFQTDEGEWIDPNSLNTEEFDQILAAAAALAEESNSINNELENENDDDNNLNNGN